MAPLVRVGMVGLSKAAAASWASAAHLPYLLSPQGKAKFEITALCNSTTENAKKAVEAYGLPQDTKVYGDSTELAADPDLDLIVCNVRVDKHYELIRPSVEAGKAVFCEWPLASNLEQAREVVELARNKGGKTVIGTQGRLSPVVIKLRQMLEQGQIGKVLSSEVKAAGGSNDRKIFPDALEYFSQLAVGGNIVSIGAGHLLDSVQYVIGELTKIQSTTQIQRPDVPIIDRQTKEPIKTVKSDVPDLIVATGKLVASPVAQEGATVNFSFRRGQPFPDEPPLVWTINGEKGEIRLTSPAGPAVQVPVDAKPMFIDVHDHSTDKVQRIEWGWEDWQNGLPAPSRNVGALYERFVKGDPYPTFEDALKLHETLDKLLSD